MRSPLHRLPPSPWIRHLWQAASLGCLFAAALALHAAAPREYQVKAAFLYNFTKFVEWPAESFASPADPIVIAVLGSDPFGDELNQVVRDRKVNGRSIQVISAASIADVAGAHVIFIGESQTSLFDAVRAQPDFHALTVGEADDFAAHGGMIQFTTASDKVRFEINVGAAERAGLKVSAQLQKLAAAVHRKP
jgi:hypothetical protein